MKGTPFVIKCPSCRRGMFRHLRRVLGVRKTGAIDLKHVRSKHRGVGSGGSGFRGHRGEMECLDCGHKWFSTHPDSGRVRCGGPGECPAHS